MLEGHHCSKPYEVFSQDEIDRIHRGTLEVLAETGITVADQRAREIMEGGGCQVDHDSERVRIPADVVESSIKLCPDEFDVRARTPELSIRLGGERVYFSSFPGFTWLDPERNERVEPTVEHLGMLTRLCDALPEIHTICQPNPHLIDKPPEIALEWVHATELRNTDKTILGTAFGGSSRWMVKMVQASDQETLGGICISSPLLIPEDQAQGILDYVEAGLPVQMLSGPMRGATGPATMAGTLILQNAEILAGTVLAQVANPGIGVLYTAYATPMDMRYGTMASGSIDVGVMAVGAAQIARRYGMPSGVFFPMTDSKVPDAQASYEKHLQTLLCAMAGIHYIMPLGGLENESAFSPAQLVLDNEVCQMVGKVLEGIRVDDERMAVDLIKEVGPVPGNYLRKEHTRQHWREGYLVPELSVRESYEAWVEGGSKTALDLATEKAIHLMKSHQPRPLPAEADEAIAEILKEAESVKLAG